MKKMMRLTAVLAALSMAFCGCSSGSTAETAAETETAVETAAETEASTDAADETAAEDETEEAVEIDMSAGLDDDGNLADIKAEDYVTLPDYSAIKLKQADIDVTDQEVEDSINEVLANYATTNQVTDRACVSGDTVNIDYVGKIDGVEFDGGSTDGAGTDLELGSGSYVDNFEDQIVGHTPGDTFTVTVTFPDDYGNEDLNGKTAEFETTLNYISESVTPELTDDFVTENLEDSYGYKTVEEFRTGTKEDLETDKKNTAIWNWLTENSTFSQEPDSLTEIMCQTYVDMYTMYATNYGMELEEFLSYYGFEDAQAVKDYYWDDAQTYAEKYVITQAVCDAENLQADDAALDEYFDGEDYSSYTEYYGSGYVKMQVKFNLVYEFMLERTTFE